MRIGFNTEPFANKHAESEYIEPMTHPAPRKSVVQVYFAERNMKLAYYNDQFDLKCGDLVYVDGKLEGMLGRVTEVSYNFKIKVSDDPVACVDRYINFFNEEKPSYSLNYLTPKQFKDTFTPLRIKSVYFLLTSAFFIRLKNMLL